MNRRKEEQDNEGYHILCHVSSNSLATNIRKRRPFRYLHQKVFYNALQFICDENATNNDLPITGRLDRFGNNSST